MKNYKIGTDGTQWLLYIETDWIEKKTGKPKKEILGYHTTLEAAVRAAEGRLQRDLWPEGGVGLSELAEALRALSPRLTALLEEARGETE